MKRFEYEITIHPVEQFRQLAYLCTNAGECSPEQIPADQKKVLGNILNDHGVEGWELVQMFFSSQGLVAVWKRGR